MVTTHVDRSGAHSLSSPAAPAAGWRLAGHAAAPRERRDGGVVGVEAGQQRGVGVGHVGVAALAQPGQSAAALSLRGAQRQLVYRGIVPCARSLVWTVQHGKATRNVNYHDTSAWRAALHS